QLAGITTARRHNRSLKRFHRAIFINSTLSGLGGVQVSLLLSWPYTSSERTPRPRNSRIERGIRGRGLTPPRDLLGEHGLPGDTPAARQEFERRMEARRLEPGDEAGRKPLRRGRLLGSQEFRQKMLEQIDGKIGEHHLGKL